MHEGVIVAERIAGVKGVHPLNTSNVPGCTYCWPQVASVGLTEAKAKETGRKIKVGRFPFIGNGKAIALGEAEGLVKTVFDAETGELLGAHMIGAEVTELIQGYVIAKTGELTDAGTGAHHLPASDPVGNDARSGARCGQKGAAHLNNARWPGELLRRVYRSSLRHILRHGGDVAGVGGDQPDAAVMDRRRTPRWNASPYKAAWDRPNRRRGSAAPDRRAHCRCRAVLRSAARRPPHIASAPAACRDLGSTVTNRTWMSLLFSLASMPARLAKVAGQTSGQLV